MYFSSAPTPPSPYRPVLHTAELSLFKKLLTEREEQFSFNVWNHAHESSLISLIFQPAPRLSSTPILFPPAMVEANGWDQHECPSPNQPHHF